MTPVRFASSSTSVLNLAYARSLTATFPGEHVPVGRSSRTRTFLLTLQSLALVRANRSFGLHDEVSFEANPARRLPRVPPSLQLTSILAHSSTSSSTSSLPSASRSPLRSPTPIALFERLTLPSDAQLVLSWHVLCELTSTNQCEYERWPKACWRRARHPGRRDPSRVLRTAQKER